MEKISATDARRRFGAFLKRVDEAPLSITKDNREVAVAISSSVYAELVERTRGRDSEPTT